MSTINEIMTVHYDEKPIYKIAFYNDFSMLATLCEELNTNERKLCIVSDSHVAPHYLEAVKEQVASCCSYVSTFVFDAGEESKNLNTVRNLYEHLILEHFERRDMLIALGGGVVGDLTGYTAATYLRGIDFIQIPTSLLAQVDSSIGGKTGVDFDAYKNMVGAFHQPKLVYINTSTLQTLNKRQYLSGMGEIVKYGLITDRPFFDWIIENREAIINLNQEVIREMIYRSCDNKRIVVEKDPTEKGERALLNFGHTLGHAIEKLTNFNYLHGECVFVGSILASRIACSKKLISQKDLELIEKTIRLFESPDIKEFDSNQVVAAVKNDKKMSAGKIKFILLESIGHAFITRDVTDEDMFNVLEEYKNEQ